MPRDKCEIPVDFVVYALFGVTFGEMFEVFLKDLKIVLTPASLTSVSGYFNLWFDLGNSDNYGFADNK